MWGFFREAIKPYNGLYPSSVIASYRAIMYVYTKNRLLGDKVVI